MVKLITDSTSDLTFSQVAQLGVDIVPLTINFADRSYIDGIELSPEEFYKKLAAADTLPTTSQATPAAFETLFRRYIAAGEEIVCILISSKLSGTFQSATIAKEMVGSPEKIHLIDSQNVSFALGLLVKVAAGLRDQGQTAAAIAQTVSALCPRLRIVAAVSTLKYLKMGGRLSATSAILGNIMGIRPIVSVKNGVVSAIGKVKGLKSAFSFLLHSMQKEGVCPQYPVSFGHADAPEMMEKCIDYFSSYIDPKSILRGVIGSIVGTHAGPGAFGVAYIAKEA